MDRPINQVFLGGDSFHSLDSLDVQIQNMEMYRNKLQQLKALQNTQSSIKLIWDDIDNEIKPLTIDQKKKLFENNDYVELYTKLNELVQIELLNLVKAKIESTQEGKDLLEQQLKLVKKLKNTIIQETNKELELFKKFKDFSKLNPEVTYEEFIKAQM